MRKYLLLSVLLSANCFLAFTQTSSQIKTASVFNASYGANFWYQYGPEYVSVDDGSYAYSKRLSPHRGALDVVLQGFGFTIPSDATIERIIVRARRFKQGRGSIRDYFAYLVRNQDLYRNDYYGFRWRNSEYYPDVETDVIYSENGTGTDGTYPYETYQWTPAMINDPAFGVRIQNYEPEGRGYVIVYYDLVEITVEYSQPVTVARRSPDATETKPLKEPVVYPNPFTTNTNIQFTAAESGKAVVELFNTSGSKIKTLFSGRVVQGQVYNVSVGDAQLPKGIYVYKISEGVQKYTGRVIKLE
jgi:hypothetical protein